MKKSIIKDIFNGIRGNIEVMEMSDEVKKEAACEDKIYEKLKEKLSPELLNLLNNYADATNSRLCEEVDFYFVEGFKLGLLIGIECMEN